MLIPFIAVTTILFMFPFAPTAGLFLRRRQALGPSPLSEGAYAPDHFARNLIAKLRARAALIAQPLITVFEYRLDGEPLLILPASMRRVPSECATKMSYALADAVLPGALPCDKEIAAEGSLLTGGGIVIAERLPKLSTGQAAIRQKIKCQDKHRAAAG